MSSNGFHTTSVEVICGGWTGRSSSSMGGGTTVDCDYDYAGRLPFVGFNNARVNFAGANLLF